MFPCTYVSPPNPPPPALTIPFYAYVPNGPLPSPLQVDWVLNYLSSLLDYNLKLHGKNASSFQSAREFAFGTVQGYVDQIKATFDPQGIVEAMVDTLKRLASTAVSYADPDKVVDAATSWYNYLTSYNLGEWLYGCWLPITIIINYLIATAPSTAAIITKQSSLRLWWWPDGDDPAWPC